MTAKPRPRGARAALAPLLALVDLETALSAYEAGRYEQARVDLERLLERAGEGAEPELLLDVALAAARAGDLRRADELLARLEALGLDPTTPPSPEAWNRLLATISRSYHRIDGDRTRIEEAYESGQGESEEVVEALAAAAGDWLDDRGGILSRTAAELEPVVGLHAGMLERGLGLTFSSLDRSARSRRPSRARPRNHRLRQHRRRWRYRCSRRSAGRPSQA